MTTTTSSPGALCRVDWTTDLQDGDYFSGIHFKLGANNG